MNENLKLAAIAPREALASFTRECAKTFGPDDWDGLHSFSTLHWDGDRVQLGTVGIIDPSMPPEMYPELMKQTALGSLLADDVPTPCAYSLQFESHMVMIAPDAPDEVRAAYDRAADAREVYKLPDAVEQLMVLTADVYGNLWQVSKRRDTGEITETFIPATDRSVESVQASGRFYAALMAVAEATGMTHYDLPLPERMAERLSSWLRGGSDEQP